MHPARIEPDEEGLVGILGLLHEIDCFGNQLAGIEVLHPLLCQRTGVHNLLLADEWLRKVDTITSEEDYHGAGMLQHDHDVGLVLKALEDMELTDDTIFVYSTDNGPVHSTCKANQSSRSQIFQFPPVQGGKSFDMSNVNDEFVKKARQ